MFNAFIAYSCSIEKPELLLFLKKFFIFISEISGARQVTLGVSVRGLNFNL